MDSSNEYKDIAGSSSKSKVQSRQLRVTLDNRDQEAANDVSVKWAIYARTMDGNKLVTAGQGTETAKVGALQKTTVKCDRITIKGTPKHSVTTVKNDRRNGRSNITTRKQPGSGEDYYGYVVKVFAGPALLDEFYSQPALKDVK